MRTTTDELLDGDTPDLIDVRDLQSALDEWEATCIRCGAPIRFDGVSKGNEVIEAGRPVFVDATDGDACEDEEGQQGVHAPEDDDWQLLRDLIDLNSEVGTEDLLIRESYWPEYCQTFVEDVEGMSDKSWLYNYIDWDRVADDMKMDYTSYEFRGVTYYAR